MGLKNYTPVRHELSIGGGETISVRGLALNDISRLISHHLPDIEALFDLFASGAPVNDQQMQTLIMGVISDAPGFAANLIALAADEPDAAPNAELIPFPVQVDLLMKIADLTFREVGGVKKGMESIAALLNLDRIKKALPKMKKAG